MGVSDASLPDLQFGRPRTCANQLNAHIIREQLRHMAARSHRVGSWDTPLQLPCAYAPPGVHPWGAVRAPSYGMHGTNLEEAPPRFPS